MAYTWKINKSYPKEIQDKFSSLKKVLAITDGEVISKDSISTVIKVSVDGYYFYIKRYTQAGKGLRKRFGRSRCRAEWDNLKFCQQLKIQTPTIVAYGEKYKIFKRHPKISALITEAVPDAEDLQSMINHHSPLLQDSTYRKKIITTIAHYTSILHETGFIHGDLKSRNILITRDPLNPKVYFFDMPIGKKAGPFQYKHGVIKDLALLERSCSSTFSKTEKLRFFLIYKLNAYLNKENKKMIKKIIRYSRKK